MNLGIAGKVALVTASGTGLGKAAAHALAAEGAKLVLFSRSGDTLRATASEIEHRHKAPVVAVTGNMGSESDVAALAERLCTEFGGLDILVLNTGRPPHPLRVVLEENNEARWEDAYRTQLWSAALVARKIVPLMLDRGWGRIVAITSASVKQPMLKHGLSTIFRAGLTGYLKHLANEIAAKGVTVNMVCPASVVTSDRPSTYDVAERLKGIPLGRLGKPADVAAAVAFLASDPAGFITGASLNIDGGMVAALQ